MQDLHCLLNNIDLPPKYFWTQIKNDFKCLMKATGRSLDEVSIIIHLVLREITETGCGIQIHKGGQQTIDLHIITSSIYFFRNEKQRSQEISYNG